MSRATAQLGMGQLERADAATLRRLWANIRGVEPPKTFTARVMRLALAWDAQAARTGRESTKARRGWDRITKGRGEGGSIYLAGNTLHPAAGAGTRLLKEWGGATHEVMVIEGGAT